jgi:hypothetical protein
MANYIQIDEVDYDSLVDLIEYVIERYKGKDMVLVEYLEEGLNTVKEHMANEQYGAEIVAEITEVLGYIQEGDDEK